MYKFAIVLRYLRKRKIAFFPIAGVALGVMALVVVLSIMEGFDTDFRARIRGIAPDLSLNFLSADGFDGDVDEFVTLIESVPEVRAASPYVAGLGMAEVMTPVHGNPLSQYVSSAYVEFKGFDFERELRVVPTLAEHLMLGEDFFSKYPYGTDAETHFIVGARLAGKRYPDRRTKETDWGLAEPGNRLRLATLSVDFEPKAVKGPVVDVVSSGMYEVDAHMLFLPLDWARALRRLQGEITGVGIALEDYNPESVAAAKDGIRSVLTGIDAGNYRLESWEESRRTILIAIAMERRIMAFILFFFLVVAGFSIAAILIMIVLEKIRDIGILRAMGASARGIAGIFLTYGFVIGLVGAAIGLTLGVTFVKNIDLVETIVYKATGWQPFPPEIYDLPEIPRILNWWTCLYIVATALFVSLAASVLPAVRAALLDPVEAIRYE